jgi:hypothetical protein
MLKARIPFNVKTKIEIEKLVVSLGIERNEKNPFEMHQYFYTRKFEFIFISR